MGARGPKAEPLAFKRPAARLPAFDTAPPPELLFDVPAALEWDRLAPILAAAGQITEADRAALVSYCRTWAVWLRAAAEANGQPLTIQGVHTPIANPAYVMLDRAHAALLRAAAALGLTPASRSSVRAAPTGAAAAPTVSTGTWGALLK